MNDLVSHALNLVQPQFRLDLHHSYHGISHWARVWRNAKELCNEMEVDPTVPCLFSFFHDSQRFDEGNDFGHGARACSWLEQLYIKRKLSITAIELHLLCEAVSWHSDGKTDADPIIQICWDADRLDLGRVGVMPDATYLCTDHAKLDSTINEAFMRSIRKSCH
jgi:uncharacterized protein